MKQFDLSVWLQDKSRKVVTRRGNPVRIVCWDRKYNHNDFPIIALEDWDNGEYVNFVSSNGKVDLSGSENIHDIFFADEEEETIDDTEMNSLAYLTELGYTCIPPKKEEELTEFEKAISEFIQKLTFNGNVLSSKDIKGYAKSLLDLARKELQPEIDKELDEAYKSRDEVVYLEGYDQGKQDALKDLPKWKKATENKEFDKHILFFEDGERVVLTTELYKGEYYIEVDDLKSLPKEE